MSNTKHGIFCHTLRYIVVFLPHQTYVKNTDIYKPNKNNYLQKVVLKIKFGTSIAYIYVVVKQLMTESNSKEVK